MSEEKVSSVFIGSSNVCNFYTPTSYIKFRRYELKKACRVDIFKLRMEDIREEENEVIISVLENFIADEVMKMSEQERDQHPEKIDDAIRRVLEDFARTVRDLAGRSEKRKILVVQVITRPWHVWFVNRYEMIVKHLEEEVTKMKMKNVILLKAPPMIAQQFDSKGVHLTPQSARIFLETVLEAAEVIFGEGNDEEDVEMNIAQDIMKTPLAGTSGIRDQATPMTGAGPGPAQVISGISGLRAEVVELKEDIMQRRVNDSLVSARLREEMDAMINSKKEDKIILTGMTNTVAMPTEQEEKIKWMREMVGAILNRIVPDSAEKITFIKMGRNNNREIPLAEVKMESRELAMEIRKKYAAKRRDGEDFGKLFLANSVTLGTRVRVDILKAMANKFTTPDLTIQVSNFVARPVLQLRRPDKSGFALTFSDALVRYGGKLEEEDLTAAYKRAGKAFEGQLQQNFGVLHDTPTGAVDAPQTFGRPQLKRQRSEGGPGYGSKRGRGNGGYQRGGRGGRRGGGNGGFGGSGSGGKRGRGK